VQNISFHIAYLLTNHDKVIVHGLGAFIVLPLDKGEMEQKGILSPPENILKFDSEVKQNDDLLVNSIVKEKKCTYEEANVQIDQYVTQVLNSLHEGKNVRIPWVGTLYMKDNKILFQTEKALSCNAFNYGLTEFSLPYIKDLQQEADTLPKKSNKKFDGTDFNGKLLVYIGLIAVALIAIGIFLIVVNQRKNDYFNPDKIQVADTTKLLEPDTIDEEPIATDTTTQVQPDSVAMPEKTPKSDVEVITSDNKGNYYIVIASCMDQPSAEKTLAEIKLKGFNDADMVFSDSRYRIYVARFESEAKAGKFIIQFKKYYPAYTDAWLLVKQEQTN